MLSSGLQSNFNIIEPLPRFFTIRFGRQRDIEELYRDDDDGIQVHCTVDDREKNLNEAVLPPRTVINEDNSSSIIITGVRQRDWNFNDDVHNVNNKDMPNIKYQLIPSITNTVKSRSTNFIVDKSENRYEEYDLDEQDLQWLMAYNQFRFEKDLPELDENVFEYIIQLLEHQCLLAVRKKNYEDTIQCDACHRIDNVDDLIKCIQCKVIVHKKCYGIHEEEKEWLCLSCQFDIDQPLCCVCDRHGGALKIFKTSSDPLQQLHWVHLSCAFWLPNVEFDEKMTPNLKEALNCDGYCYVCTKTTGVKINCCWTNCQIKFHPLCAIKAGQDMFVAESDDQIVTRLLALCHQHTTKVDQVEKRMRRQIFLETQQKRFEQFSSYVDLEQIKTQTSILPDVLDSIHTYWVLKRQSNNCRPLVDIPDDIFYHDYDKNINLEEFSRQFHLEHQNQMKDSNENTPNALQFLFANTMPDTPTQSNLFAKYAQRDRAHFVNYERNLFCLLDSEKKKRDSFLDYLSFMKENV